MLLAAQVRISTTGAPSVEQKLLSARSGNTARLSQAPCLCCQAGVGKTGLLQGLVGLAHTEGDGVARGSTVAVGTVDSAGAYPMAPLVEQPVASDACQRSWDSSVLRTNVVSFPSVFL